MARILGVMVPSCSCFSFLVADLLAVRDLMVHVESAAPAACSFVRASTLVLLALVLRSTRRWLWFLKIVLGSSDFLFSFNCSSLTWLRGGVAGMIALMFLLSSNNILSVLFLHCSE